MSKSSFRGGNPNEASSCIILISLSILSFILKLGIGSTSASSVQAFQLHSKQAMWFVYLLLCDQKTFYVGITPDLFTKKFSEIELVYCEKYDDKYQAAKREKQLKGWSVAKKKMLIEGKLGINRVLSLPKSP